MRDKNLKYLVIVESPNKCQHFQEYLRKAGYKVNVVASVGHISNIKDGGNYYVRTKHIFGKITDPTPEEWKVL